VKVFSEYIVDVRYLNKASFRRVGRCRKLFLKNTTRWGTRVMGVSRWIYP